MSRPELEQRLARLVDARLRRMADRVPRCEVAGCPSAGQPDHDTGQVRCWAHRGEQHPATPAPPTCAVCGDPAARSLCDACAEVAAGRLERAVRYRRRWRR